MVGRFCSIAEGLKIYRRNHPVNYISTHPLFFNSKLGLLEKDSILSIEDNPLIIGNDVWIGANVTILPGCRVIGDGIVIGAGSVVTKDIEPFTVVAGAPARVIRKRFSEDIETILRASRWWEKPLEALLPYIELFLKDLNWESAERLKEINSEDSDP